MNKEIKAKWIKALRSGKYRQTRGKLKSRNGAFCCLGVLCDIQGAKAVWQNDLDGGNYVFGGDKISMPPKPYWAEVPRDQLDNLARRNDGYSWAGNPPSENFHKHSFSEIADYIEENL